MIFLMCICISLPYIYIAQIKKLVKVNKENLIEVKIINLCEITQEAFLADLLLAINDYVICCIIPFFLAFTFSLLTLFQLFKNKRIKVDISSDIKNQNPEPDSNNIDNKSIIRSSIKRLQKSELQVINHNSISNFKLTIMLMTLPICYVITNFPIFLILISQFITYTNNDHKANENKLELVIAKVFMYTNNSINILFYIFLGKNFKKVFTDLIFKIFHFKYIHR